MRTPSRSLEMILSACLVLPAVGCGDESNEPKVQRGMGENRRKGGSDDGANAGAAIPAGEEGGVVEEGPPRPPVALDSKSFQRRRDPFMSFMSTEELVAEPPTISERGNRKVFMASYALEDLKLISVVTRIGPRALFLASDGKSKTIHQGEHFSSAEVRLAAVNQDYVEIEVVDDDLGSSLNLQRGERRAIYLRTP